MSPMVDTENYRTQEWPEIALPDVELRFAPIELTPLDSSEKRLRPSGFIFGPFAIHAVFHYLESRELDAAPRWRVSALESGCAIADFYRFELALCFSDELKQLDWSGGWRERAAIVQRNQTPVLAAFKKWSALAIESEGSAA